ncbi:NADP oxidoreductase coenzyme F420-dependent [Seminavis robusta]|uniref:NADP oxidoreductase coenzyme F420-dependent n=1 Tax=Seminavis robusta TaxID=568900 RepID=A0A9N8HLK4_9STRA|nr:NADP oxidoreductase coenzyme F420-dependent [Seminavis robusta]|eukprot:Sro816_g206600.1 NADP oxidoreductase coenzyme F420-dependent (308) ;mRNA; f:1557-2813
MAETDGNSYEPVSIGVLGCGTIASALITGMCKTQAKADPSIPVISRISLSRRSEKKSAALKEAYPDLVTVYDDNQKVLDTCDLVFLCVLNNQTATVLEPLQFDNQRHTLVSMVATSKLDMLTEATKLNPERVFKMICLPSAAKQEGCALIVPKVGATEKAANPTISTIHCMLDLLGGFVECETEEIMDVMITPTCLMGPLYGILRQNQEWLVKKGVPAKDATYFVGRQYWSMMQDAERGCQKDPNHFEELVAEQTPGGLNEQALRNLTQLGIYGAYDQAMEAVLSRLHGDSDGSLPTTKENGIKKET